ncbi:MAG TPA: putative quinol monooxygenase [Syntrophales bacterium]|nr:putative quinol monooxygenase [Syntrophales bacterium]
MISVIASVRVKADRLSEFIGILKANVPEVRKEKGCMEYLPTVDIDSGLPVQKFDKHVVTILERWADVEALKAHLKTPHMLAYRQEVKDIVENLSIKVLKEA